MLITVSGPPGSGKTTTAAGLADRFGLEHVSGGNIFRDLAAERGYSLAEFNELAEENDQIDRDLDRRLYETARSETDIVLESRLSGWLAGEHADFRIWLDAPLDVRANRIADREDKHVPQARVETEQREASEYERYQTYYNIDITDLSIYDVTLNTARWEPDTIVEILEASIQAYDPDDDEGKIPIQGVDYEF